MNKKFLLGIVVFLLFVLVMEFNAPAKFVWRPTFGHYDSQPFGCAVFDTLMQKSIPAGYHVTNKTFAQLERDGYGKKPHAILVQTLAFNPTETDRRALSRLLKAGNKVLIVTSDFACDSSKINFGVAVSGRDTFLPQWVKKSLLDYQIPMDTLYWNAVKPYTPHTYQVYTSMSGYGIEVNEGVQCDTLLCAFQRSIDGDVDTTDVSYDLDDDEYADKIGGYWQALLIRIKWGKGELFLSCDPLLWTNYGVLDPEINGLLFRAMSQFRGLPVTRTDAYAPKNEINKESPLRYWLQNAPLRWCVYLTLLGLLLFCVFYARRRQRVIPVVKQPENKSLEFVKLIGTLYYQKHENHDLLQKKYSYFAETVRRQLLIDVDDEESRRENITQLALRTGMPEAEVRMILDKVKRYIEADTILPDRRLQETIDGLDIIINNL
ncbi:DUF4350 domain-containing protein [Prevotella veroralis]